MKRSVAIDKHFLEFLKIMAGLTVAGMILAPKSAGLILITGLGICAYMFVIYLVIIVIGYIVQQFDKIMWRWR